MKKFPIIWKYYQTFRSISRNIYFLLVNIFLYGHFSFNKNVKSYWNNKLSKYNGFWRNENYYHILDVFPQDSEFSLLDIGCAIGDGCELLHRKFPKAKIKGTDISKIGIEKAKQKTKKVHYFTCDILKDPIPGSYDYVTIIETLEHFDNPFFVITKLLQHVKKSLIVSVPYNPNFTGKINKQEHRYSFNKNTFADTNYNYRIIKITDFINCTKSKCIIYEFFPN